MGDKKAELQAAIDKNNKLAGYDPDRFKPKWSAFSPHKIDPNDYSKGTIVSPTNEEGKNPENTLGENTSGSEQNVSSSVIQDKMGGIRGASTTANTTSEKINNDGNVKKSKLSDDAKDYGDKDSQASKEKHSTFAQMQNERSANNMTRGASRRNARLAEALNNLKHSKVNTIKTSLRGGGVSGGGLTYDNKQINTQEMRNQQRAENYEAQSLNQMLNRQDLLMKFPYEMQQLKLQTQNMLNQGMDENTIKMYVQSWTQWMQQRMATFNTNEQARGMQQLADIYANAYDSINNPYYRSALGGLMGIGAMDPLLARLQNAKWQYAQAQNKFTKAKTEEERQEAASAMDFWSKEIDNDIETYRSVPLKSLDFNKDYREKK